MDAYFFRLSLLLFCILSTRTEALAQWISDDSAPPTSVDEIMDAHRENDAPGAAYAIVRSGKIVDSGYFGNANLEHQVNINSSTRFYAASVSKQFTAYAMLKLADEGLVDLDKPINRYLPELSKLPEQITLRHLIHHTSGLKDDLGMLALAGWRHEDMFLSEDVLNVFRGQDELTSMPGERYTYSNTNYSLLAHVLSRVTGQSFSEWTQTNIFDALDMNHSGFVDSPEIITPNRASNYEKSDDKYKRRSSSWYHVGAGGLYTSAEDMAKWSAHMMNKSTNGSSILERMSERGRLKDGNTTDYAYGLVHGTQHGLPIINHGGSSPGNQSSITFFPENDLAIVIFSNQSGGPLIAGRIAADIAALYLAEEIEAQAATAQPRRMLMITTEDLASTPEGSYPADPATYSTYTGTFQLEEADRFKDDLLLARPLIVSQDGDRLLLSFGEPPGIPLAPIGEHRFRVIKMNFEVTFQIGTNGKSHGLIFHITEDSFGDEPVEDLYAYKQNIEELTPSALKEYTGLYYSPEIETVYRFSMGEDNQLQVFHPRHGLIPLRYLGPNEFLADTHIFTNVSFSRNASGLPERVRLRGYSWGSNITLQRLDVD